MFHKFSNHVWRILAIYAVLLNMVLGTGFALFLFKPGTALPLYRRFIEWRPQNFIDGLVSPSWGDSWFVVVALLNATWLIPAFILFAVGLIFMGVRPELAKHGIVALGRDTATRGDDSLSWFGITNGALLGMAMLGGLAAAISYVLTSDQFLSIAQKRNLHGVSIASGIEGYRDFVRGFIGTQTPAPERPASARAALGRPVVANAGRPGGCFAITSSMYYNRHTSGACELMT